MLNMADEYLTVEEAAAKLKIHPRTIRRLLVDGKLPGVKFGARQWRIPVSALERGVEQALANRKAAAPKPE
jgi:excisionase family DNA binding protein